MSEIEWHPFAPARWWMRLLARTFGRPFIGNDSGVIVVSYLFRGRMYVDRVIDLRGQDGPA